MLICRNFCFLTKVVKQNGAAVKYVPQIARELRNLPRQSLELDEAKEVDRELPNHRRQTTQVDNIHSRIRESANKYLKDELRQMEKEHDPNTSTTKATSSFGYNNNSHLPISTNIENEEESSLEVGEAKKDYVPTFNFAAYVNKSPTLQQFVKLGVNLHSIERRKGLAKFLLGLEFEKDVKPYLYFLQDQGVSPDLFGEFITKNPLIFKIDVDDLQTRVNYLESKNFTVEQRLRIFSRNPYWLMFSTRRIDRRLGHFQKEFRLSGDDIRFLTTKQPRLITYSMEHIRKSTFCIREEMGFDKDEIKCLLLNKPRLWMMKSDDVIERFAYAHQTMQLSHGMLLQFPEVLASREFRLSQRHGFLVTLGRAQYDPEKDLYISPRDLVSGNDYQFVRNVAKSDLQTYELFLKTL
ncbi:transcription termination factor 3, mitochondrial [Eurosta solidaginis]|uniref:transcription termination factor 3, mitochondrial n=1 Tax=Eurosta solidaginis TaxID=178769 RepID=UPI0035307549